MSGTDYKRPSPQQQSQINDLIDRASNGDEEGVRQLLDQGISPNVRSVQGISDVQILGTPLQAALSREHFGVAELLFSRGADLNYPSMNGLTIAFSLAQKKDDGIAGLKWLVDRHGVDFQDKSKNTLLHYAAHTGTIEAAELLIDRGIDVNAKNEHGWTPLHDAFCRSDGEMAKMLHGRGADVAWRSRSGELPSHSLCYVETILSAHEQGINLDEARPRGMRLIHDKDKHKNTDCFRTLIALGCSTEGCYGVIKEHQEAIDKTPFANAVDTRRCDVLLAHLGKFGPPSPENLKAAKGMLNRNGEMKALLDAFMVHEKFHSIARQSRAPAP